MDLETRQLGDEGTKPDEETANNEPDLLPEYCRYRDEGCEFAGSCLSCPFPQCLYDEPRGKQRWLKEQRNKEIARLFRGGGWGVKELASLFGLSQRTVQRALKSTLLISAKQGRGR
jgi:AraC-like DNA-binding protein